MGNHGACPMGNLRDWNHESESRRQLIHQESRARDGEVQPLSNQSQDPKSPRSRINSSPSAIHLSRTYRPYQRTGAPAIPVPAPASLRRAQRRNDRGAPGRGDLNQVQHRHLPWPRAKGNGEVIHPTSNERPPALVWRMCLWGMSFFFVADIHLSNVGRILG